MTEPLPITPGLNEGPQIWQDFPGIDAQILADTMAKKLQEADPNEVAKKLEGVSAAGIDHRPSEPKNMPDWVRQGLTNVMSGFNIPKEMRHQLVDIAGVSFPNDWLSQQIMGVMLICGMVFKQIGTIWDVADLLIKRAFNAQTQPNILEPQHLLAWEWWTGRHQEAINTAAQHGYSPERWREFELANREKMSRGELYELYRREALTPAEFTKELEKIGVQVQGYEPLHRNLVRKLLAPSEWTELRRRGVVTKQEVLKGLQHDGYNAEDCDRLLNLIPRLLDPDRLTEAYHRGIISEPLFYDTLKLLGYTDDAARVIEGVGWWIQSPTDLIQQAVHEVFTPSLVTKFRLYDNFPEPILPLARKIGIKEETMRQFWAGHWRLLSAEDGRDLFWRGLITRDELEQIMRAYDINPWAREKMLEASYKLIPRRTLYMFLRHGVWNEAQLAERYQKLGYTADDSRDMARLDTKRATEPDKEVTRAQLLTAFRYDVLNEAETRKHLEDIGYLGLAIDLDIAETKRKKALDVESEDEQQLKDTAGAARNALKTEILRQFEIGLIPEETAVLQLMQLGYARSIALYFTHERKLEMERDRVTKLTKQVERQFMAWVYGVDSAKAELMNIGLLPEAAMRLIEQWAAERQADQAIELTKVKEPTKADLGKWVTSGIMTVPQWVQRMRRLNYAEQDIRFYLMELMDNGPPIPTI